MRAVATAIAVVLAAGHAHGQATPEVVPAQHAFGEHGWLDTQVRQVRRPNCWTLILRGNLRNPYGESVRDVRRIVRLRSAGEAPRELERLETVLPLAIEPGQSTPFSRELSTGCTTSYHDISVVAFAAHRGAAEFPAPAPEVELAASRPEQAASAPGNIPIITSSTRRW